jgi:nitrate/nitrite transporter NarK
MVALLALALGMAASAEGPSWATAIETGGDQAGAASGIMNGIGNLGGLLAPVVTPFVAQRAGWTAGLYVGSAVVFVGALAWFFIHPAETTGAPLETGKGALE